MRKKAFITGVTGQDGSYLSEFLIKKGYEVHGLRRRVSSSNLSNLKNLIQENGHCHKNFFLHYGDITDSSNIYKLLMKIEPNEIYNLAAQSHVHLSYQIPEYTSEVNALGAVKLLEGIFNILPKTKFYQASTSELYGNTIKKNKKLNEKSKFDPCSPYAISKLYAFKMVENYRLRGLFACNGILFNHESPRRSSNFVTRKIVEAAARISEGKLENISLGNLDARRDWGYAKEYVKMMWMMLQQKTPKDFVAATGKSHSVREFVEKVFVRFDKMIIWKGKGSKEVGIDKKTNKVLIKIDKYYYRPTDVNNLVGDSSLAKKILTWKAKTNLDSLIDIMIESELINTKKNK